MKLNWEALIVMNVGMHWKILIYCSKRDGWQGELCVGQGDKLMVVDSEGKELEEVRKEGSGINRIKSRMRDKQAVAISLLLAEGAQFSVWEN